MATVTTNFPSMSAILAAGDQKAVPPASAMIFAQAAWDNGFYYDWATVSSSSSTYYAGTLQNGDRLAVYGSHLTDLPWSISRAEYYFTEYDVNVSLFGSVQVTSTGDQSGTLTRVVVDFNDPTIAAITMYGSDNVASTAPSSISKISWSVNGSTWTSNGNFSGSVWISSGQYQALVTGNVTSGTLSNGAYTLTIDGVSVDINYDAQSMASYLAHLLAGNDSVNGTSGGEFLFGFGGSDYLSAGGGSDTLDGGDGIDSLLGGKGDDLYLINGQDTVIEQLGEGADRVESAENYTLATNVEQLTLTGTASINGAGSADSNLLTGNSGNNNLNGGGGDDTLSGGLGDDTLIGGAGNDSMAGGDGNDVYYADVTGDKAVESAITGSVDLVVSAVNYTLGANLENLELLVLSGSLSGTGNVLNNVITGNSGNNVLDGASGADTLLGGDGNDSLTGGAGADSLQGGLGDDVYVIGFGDVIIENAAEGTDTVMSEAGWTLGANIESLALGGSANVNGLGNELSNTITGNGGNNALKGNDGNDTLMGGLGNDTLTGSTGADSLVGGAGSDTYIVDALDTVTELGNQGIDTMQSAIAATAAANVENVTLIGGQGASAMGNLLANTLIGNIARNALNGAGGNDTLVGGAGNDTLTGGGGNDVFSFDSALSGLTNVDRINDFIAGSDRVQLDKDIFTVFSVGVAVTADQFFAGAGAMSARDGDDRLIYNTTTGALYYDADGAGGNAAIRFAVMGATVHPTVSASDFVIVT